VIKGINIMKLSSSYFVIEGVRKVDAGSLRLMGQFILNGGTQIEIPSSSSSDDDTKKHPSIRINVPSMFEVKWILPPRTSEFYCSVKAFAEGAGYETVEHDDFSYPPSLG